MTLSIVLLALALQGFPPSGGGPGSYQLCTAEALALVTTNMTWAQSWDRAVAKWGSAVAYQARYRVGSLSTYEVGFWSPFGLIKWSRHTSFRELWNAMAVTECLKQQGYYPRP